MMTIRIFVIAFIIVLLVNISGILEPVNNKIYDYYLFLNQNNYINKDIVIISIDEKSIKKIGYWPWPRKIYSTLLKELIKATPAVIGIHLSFPDTQGNLKDDGELFKILKSYPDIVLEAKLKKNKIGSLNVIEPEKTIFPGIKQGHTVFAEQDVVRSFPPFKVVPAFSLQVLSLYYKQNLFLYKKLPEELKQLLSQINVRSYSVSNFLLIDFKRTPDKFKHFSFVDVLENKVALDNFKNKIVLIGITDRYLTPYLANPLTYQNQGVASPLVEFQAQIIDSLMDFRGLKTTPWWVTGIISILISVLFLFLIINKRVLMQGVLFAGAFGLLLLINYYLFNYMALWFPPSFLLAFITIIFGISIYLTINKIDTQLIETIKNLLKEEKIPLTQLPSNINHRVGFLNSLVQVIASDRKTIQAIIYGIINPFIVIDTNGNILWSNGCFSNLFKDYLVLNENIENLVVGINLPELLGEINKNNFYKADVSIHNKEYVCLVNSNSKQNNQFVVIFNDVTELKEIDRLKTDMMRMVSHELKVPLMQILIAAENQLEEQNLDLLKQDSMSIINSADLMKNTITNFLQLNKLENNLMDFPLESLDLNNVIQRSIDLQSLVAQKRNIQIIFNPESLPEAFINKNLMEIVINNLLSNAIKYSFDNNKVIIEAKQFSDKLKVSVIDHGIGIKEEEISKLTEKFYRATNNVGRNISGTGLGLAIVDLILSIHKSQLMIESEYNKGTTFSFMLEFAPHNESE